MRFSRSRQLFFCSLEHADEAPRELFLASAPVATPPPPPLEIAPEPRQATTSGTSPVEIPSAATAAPHAEQLPPLAVEPLEAPGLSTPSSPPNGEDLLPRAAALLPALVAAIAFVVGRAEGQDTIGAGVALVALLLVFALLGGRAATRLRRESAEDRRKLAPLLDVPALRVVGSGFVRTTAEDLRAGEEIWVHAGEIVPAEGTVVEGRAELLLFPEAADPAKKGPGDAIPAGARVTSGRLRLVVTITGRERLLTWLVDGGRERLDRVLPASRLADAVVSFGAPLLGLVSGGVARLLGADTSTSLALFAAVWGSLSGALSLELPRAVYSKRLLALARRGISFPDARSVDRAGQVNSVVLCARGTVLFGEPEVAEIESLKGDGAETILALAAGAESVVPHPIARAVLRSLAGRGLAQDACRNHQPAPGLGVVCVSSSGHELVVGSRELLLRERISIALAEDRLRKWESSGQTALLVAHDRTLVGLIALVDGLRPGARAMVQRLVDAGLEPVLLSGDSRHTTEAVGRALSIEHLRPEVPAHDRGREVEKMAEGGAFVAVVGRGTLDESALYGALVPLSLGVPSATIRDRAVVIASENPLDAALALVVAREARTVAWMAVLGCLVPSCFAAIATTSLVAPPVLGPLLAGVATAITYFRVRFRPSSLDPSVSRALRAK